ncbi:MAG: DUF4157 domain-containing protein [Chloroflexota bacterium]
MTSVQKTHQSQKTSKPTQAPLPNHSRGNAFNPGQLLSATETLSSVDVLSAQQKLGNAVVQRSLDSTIQRVNEGEEFKDLGGGSMNKVYKATGGEQEGYFKPDLSDDSGKQAVLSSTIDKTLGTHVLSDEKFRTIQGSKLPGLEPTKAYSGSQSSAVPGEKVLKNIFGSEITEKAEFDKLSVTAPSSVKRDSDGKMWKMTTQEHQRHKYWQPGIQRDLANIQTLDAITGQHDRHGGNFAIDDEQDTARGYDNDYLAGAAMREETSRKVDEYAGLRKSTKYEDHLQPEKPHLLSLPKTKATYKKWQERRNALRTKAIQSVDTPFGNKSQGLPSYMDEATVRTLLATKSSDFISQIYDKDPENFGRLTQDRVDDLRNRYSAVRRYAKAGAAATNLSEIDPKLKAKWGRKEYQDMVTAGTGGVLPTIVGNGKWGAKTYNAQMSDALDRPMTGQQARFSGARSYLARNVKNFNAALEKPSVEESVQTPELGALPTLLNPRTMLKRQLGKMDIKKLPAIVASSPPIPSAPVPALPVAEPSSSAAPSPHTIADSSQAVQPDVAQRGMDLMAQQMVNKYLGSGVIQSSKEPDHRRSEVVEHGGELPQQVSAAIQKQRGGGVALPETMQSEAKQILGHDFSNVRIHAGAEAHRLSRSIQAKAFTIGKDIFFKQGAYTPGSTFGRETLLHELTHVAQQAGSKNNGPLRLGAPDTAHEKQAEQFSKGTRTATTSGAGQAGVVQRSYLDEKLSLLGGKAKTLARKGKKWGLGQARNLGNEYANHFLGVTPFGKKGPKTGGSSLLDGLF